MIVFFGEEGGREGGGKGKEEWRNSARPALRKIDHDPSPTLQIETKSLNPLPPPSLPKSRHLMLSNRIKWECDIEMLECYEMRDYWIIVSVGIFYDYNYLYKVRDESMKINEFMKGKGRGKGKEEWRNSARPALRKIDHDPSPTLQTETKSLNPRTPLPTKI